MGSEFQIKPQKASETAPGNVPRAWWPADLARGTVAVCKKGGLKFLYSQVIFANFIHHHHAHNHLPCLI